MGPAEELNSRGKTGEVSTRRADFAAPTAPARGLDRVSRLQRERPHRTRDVQTRAVQLAADQALAGAASARPNSPRLPTRSLPAHNSPPPHGVPTRPWLAARRAEPAGSG